MRMLRFSCLCCLFFKAFFKFSEFDLGLREICFLKSLILGKKLRDSSGICCGPNAPENVCQMRSMVSTLWSFSAKNDTLEDAHVWTTHAWTTHLHHPCSHQCRTTCDLLVLSVHYHFFRRCLTKLNSYGLINN